MTDQKKFKIVLLKNEPDLIVVSVACTPRVPKGPRIRYDIGEIVAAIREQFPDAGDYIFGATLINYYPDKTEAQFGFKIKKKMLLLEEKEERKLLSDADDWHKASPEKAPDPRKESEQVWKKSKKKGSEIVRPFDDLSGPEPCVPRQEPASDAE